jgi:hypothetical protein
VRIRETGVNELMRTSVSDARIVGIHGVLRNSMQTAGNVCREEVQSPGAVSAGSGVICPEKCPR